MSRLNVLHALVFGALGAVAIGFTWSMVIQWVVKYEVARHAKLFAQPLRWPELFGKAFSDFMIKDGGTNEVGHFLMSSLAGPTLCFMVYACVSSFRLRSAHGDYSLAILESLGWIFLDGLVAPSSALPWYFAYRAMGCFLAKDKQAKGNAGAAAAGADPDAPAAGMAPPNRRRGSGVPGLLVSLLVSCAYVGIVYVSALLAWRHLAQATATSSVAAHVSDVMRWIQHGDAHQSTARRLYEQTKANPITRNLMYDNVFSMLATALHVTLCLHQQMGGGSVAALLMLLLTPVVAVVNFFTAGSVWAGFLIFTEMGVLGPRATPRSQRSSQSAASKKSQ